VPIFVNIGNRWQITPAACSDREGQVQPDPKWTTGGRSLAPDEGLHQTVARIAGRHPHSIAVIAQGRRTTYRDLDETADGWAAELTRAGIGSGELVPIMLPRGRSLIIAMLAVLKTGAAYALLEASWPARRRQEVIEELGARLLVAPISTSSSPTLQLWTPPVGLVRAPPWFQPASVSGADPCCVFFTSGTTGRPKGVVSPHRATARLFQSNSFARFTNWTVMPLAAAVPWDAFSLELWAVLLNGGTSLVIDEPYLSAMALRRAVAEHGANTVWLTSTLFTMLVDEDPAAFVGLEQLMVGGERLSRAHVAAILRQHPEITLFNGYGPVESTIFAATHRITEVDVDRPDGIPLGRPVPGTRIQVLDGDRQCAVGELGEIGIAGTGLASRYLGDEALTSRKFVSLAVERAPETYYRTGDLGFWDEDGLLHFRGRADRQLKIRGHRIEPAEVERQVERLLPTVRDCRIVARPATDGATGELIAFCIPTEPGDLLTDACSVLRAALVAYQRPTAVVSVPVFPLTDRGKLDEAALLALAPVCPVGAVAASDCRDQRVALVAEVFGEVLGVAAVSPTSSLFELGGSSLDAGRVCARLTVRLGRSVPVSSLFQNPTAAGLAGRLGTSSLEQAQPETGGGGPLTPMQLAYLIRQLARPTDRTGYCVLIWCVQGELDLAALQLAIEEVHLRHEPLSTCYLADPSPAGWLVDVPPPDLADLPAQPSTGRAIQTLRTFFTEELDLAEGQVWRAAVVPVIGGERTLFGCVVHHIAFDGWSESVLARDLSLGYAAARGSPVLVSPLPPSLEQVQQIRSARQFVDPDLRDGLLAGLLGVPALRWPPGATDTRPDGPVRVQAELPPAAVASVDAVAADLGITRFAVLLARWANGLAETVGQSDFAVGVPVAQRDRAELEHAIGCHITMICLRMRGVVLGNAPACYQAAGRLVTRALAAQDVPLQDLLSLAVPSSSERPPLFQTLFALQDNAEPRLQLAGLSAEFLRQPYLDLPLELHAELWPTFNGGLRLVVDYQPDRVAAATARELVERFITAPSLVRLRA
jgi:mycobactin peptide synthetase MbtE